MATPLNIFKTVTKQLTTADSDVYTAPANNTSIILMAQVSNITSTAADVTFSHYDSDTSTQTELVKDFSIAGKDANSVITGKLVLETGQKIKAQASANSSLKLTLSILESLNA